MNSGQQQTSNDKMVTSGAAVNAHDGGISRRGRGRGCGEEEGGGGKGGGGV